MDKATTPLDLGPVSESVSVALPSAAVLPVSLLVGSARLLIERHLGLGWVSGEVSNFSRASSGHCYFVLKDSSAQVRCVLFKNKMQLMDVAIRDGLRVEVRATPTIYEARGEFQLNVETVRLAGQGALFEKFVRLKARLEAAGWFRAERKRAIPSLPRAVGIVTSIQAAALRDVLITLRRRFPGQRVIIYPSAVQGAGAATEIAAAIAIANARLEVDVLIVCRGGGSLEDLWAFNEETVALAIFRSRIPVISGVGHETDFTICDFVADVRAATPTGAAALAVPDCAALRSQAAAMAARWRRAGERALELRMQRLDVASRNLVHPAARLAQQRATLSALAARMMRAIGGEQARLRRECSMLGQGFVRLLRMTPRETARLALAVGRLQREQSARLSATSNALGLLDRSLRHLDPLRVLERGYSIVTGPSGAIVQDAAAIAAGDMLRMRFARGEADAQVKRRMTASEQPPTPKRIP
jgi:exodeoxyribonuclease VII large subunit